MVSCPHLMLPKDDHMHRGGEARQPLCTMRPWGPTVLGDMEEAG